MGNEINFEPLRFDAIEFKGRGGNIIIVLLMTVYTDITNIGAGQFRYTFAIMPDMHIAEGKASIVWGQIPTLNIDKHSFVGILKI